MGSAAVHHRWRSRRRVAAVLALLALAMAVGCSTVLGIDADRYVADAGSGPADPWSCLSLPNEALSPNENVDLTLVVMDALQPSTSAGAIDGGSDLDTVSGAWLAGVSVRTCAIRDVSCSSGSPAVVTTHVGTAVFHLTEDFAGFFDMRRSDLVPGTLYPGNLLTGQSTVSFPAYEITPAGLRELGASITSEELSLDPAGTVGHAIVTVYDCFDHQAPGVMLMYSASSPQAVSFYFQDGLPSATAQQTDSFGLAGAVNVPTGSMTVAAVLASSKRLVGTTTFVVRPGALTFAWIRARSH